MRVKQNVDQWVSKNGGHIINSYVWGKRKLAYQVEKQRYGTYMLLNYGTEKPFVLELNSWMELDEAILSYLTIQLDKKPVSREEANTESIPDSSEKDEKV